MMLPTNIKIFLRLDPTDMRKSIDTLSIIVKDVLEQEPSSGHLFLFCNRNRDKLKALYYEQNSFTLWYRRLEQGRFVLPRDRQGHVEMTQEHFDWLLNSNRYSRADTLEEKFYQNYA